MELNHDWRGAPLPGPHPRVTLSRHESAVHCELVAPLIDATPPPGPRARRWRLWEYEVVELFIAGWGGRYIELELGPFGHFLFLAFAGVRELADDDLPLGGYEVVREGGCWRGHARFSQALLPKPPLSFNLCAISGQGERLYRSLVPLPGSQVDFHQPQYFAPWPLS